MPDIKVSYWQVKPSGEQVEVEESELGDVDCDKALVKVELWGFEKVLTVEEICRPGNCKRG